MLFERYHDRGDPVDREVLVERFLPIAAGLRGDTSALMSPSTTCSRSRA
jgi:hypothetical protein